MQRRCRGPQALTFFRGTGTQQGLAELRFFDQRRGLRSYATNRGLRLQENDTQMLVEGPAFTVTIGFGERNVVSAMTVNMRGAQQ